MAFGRRRSPDMSDTAVASPPGRVQRDALDVEALYRACAEDLFGYALTLLREPSSAEDVVATAFERALARAHRFDPRRGSARGWMFGIVRNAALDELRSRKRRGTGAALGDRDLVDADAEDPAEALADADAAALREAAVASAVERLAPRERELVALKFRAGLSNAEIGDVLGVSTSNAGTRVHRVLETLREACRHAS